MATLAVVLGATSAGRAQTRDPGAAQALFDQGRELVRQGKYDKACPKLLESNRLDPGIGTQFHLADCYEQAGKVASAWATFLDVASQARAAGQSERETAASRRAQNLEPRLPRLTIVVPESSRAPGLEIRRAGTAIGDAQWGTPVPVDPGEIEIVAAASGRQTLRQSLRLEEGKTVTFNLPTLAEQDTAAPATTAGGEAPSPEAPAAAEAEPQNGEPSAGGSKTPWVIALASAGVVGVGVGGVFGLMAKSQNDESVEHCAPNDPNACDGRGVELRNNAIADGNVSTIAFIVGGAALAGAGLLLVLDSGSKTETGARRQRLVSRASLGPGAGALLLEGAF
jgi:hypothetical protein